MTSIIRRYLAELRKLDRESAFIMAWASLVLLFSLYLSRPKNFWPEEPFLGRLIITGALFVLSPLLPMLLFRNQPRAYGLRLGRVKIWSRDLVFYYALMVVVLLISFKYSRLKTTYPLYQKAKYGLDHFLLYEAVQLGHMMGWEFFFRGFMLFGLSKKIDFKLSILIQTIPFALMHFRKPAIEAYGSIFAGVFQGLIAEQAGSFLPCALLHWLVALTADIIGIIM